jgi:iron complex outermembrane recepter protein
MKNKFKRIPLVLLIGSLTSPIAFAESTTLIETADEVIVFGRGETRQVSEIGQAEIAQAVPGASPLKILSKLPGVNSWLQPKPIRLYVRWRTAG